MNSRQRKFAEFVAGGMAAVPAYKKAGYSAKTAKANAARLMDKDGVSELIEKLQKKNAEDCRLSRVDRLGLLCDIITTPINEITSSHWMAQEVRPIFDQGIQVGETIKMPPKMDAFREIAKMVGDYAAEKAEVSHSFEERLANLIAERDQPE